MKLLLLFSHTFACALIFYSVFCRLVLTSKNTLALVRAGYVMVSLASLLALIAPVFLGYEPTWPATLLAIAFGWVQVVNARLWADGVPTHFRGD